VAQRCSGLGAYLVVRIVQAAHQHRERRLGSDFAQHVGSPGAGGVVGGIIEHGQQRLDHYIAMAGEYVGNSRRQPGLSLGQRADQRPDRVRVGDPGQCPQRDLAHVGVFGLGCLHRLEQRRDCTSVPDPAQQLGGKGAIAPLPGGPQLLDVLVNQTELVVDLEQPARPPRRGTGLLLENRLESIEIVQRAHLMYGGCQ
jgi:hypothetical protein